MGHFCRTLLWDTLVGHSCGTLLLWVTCRTLLHDTLVGHSCGTLVGHSCRKLLWDTLVGHSYRTLLWDTLVGRSCSSPETPRTKVVLKSPVLACISRARHARSPQRVARAPDKSHSRLRFAHSTRTISAEGCAGTGQIALSPAFRALDTHDLRRGLRAHGTNRTLACISRTRHGRSPQMVARAWDKSHSRLHFAHSTRTISAEGCASSLQNERFARDFLKNSHVKVCKTSVSYETSSKSQAETPIGAPTSRSPAKQFRDSSPSKHHPLTRQSQCDSDIHLYHNSQPHDSLHLPRIFPRPHVQRAQSTAPATKCHLRHTSQPHDSLRLPRNSHFHTSKPAQSPAPATKRDNIISRELQQNLHHTTRLE